MKNLPIPLKDIEERTIYHACADSFRDKTALSYIDQVVSCAEVYEEYVPRDIEHFPEYTINAGDKSKIIKVYEEKFARQDGVGRQYYEAIMTNANGRCPICGSGKVRNLDHFLPKSSYPLLCVVPANLIPLCRDCNFDKKDSYNTDYYLIPFNPYFDNMDMEWLECNLVFKEDNTFIVSYINGFDKSVDEKFWRKCETHLRIFDLDATFSNRAWEEMDNCKQKYQKLLEACGTEGVKQDLIEHKNSCEHIDINSWGSALYRELVRKVDAFCDWLS